METSFDVSKDRTKWIGGSDIPAIMGISPFTSRFDLLLFKAELLKNDFKGNEYTRYGQVMEPKIREYINKTNKLKYRPSKHEYIKYRFRCHTDGEDKDSILEIKTTSQVHKRVNTYKVYLVQLLFYMMNIGKDKGKLVIYERDKKFLEKNPEQWLKDFDIERLQVFDIKLEDYKELTEQIIVEVNRFKKDLEIVKENPLITEEELNEYE